MSSASARSVGDDRGRPSRAAHRRPGGARVLCSFGWRPERSALRRLSGPRAGRGFGGGIVECATERRSGCPTSRCRDRRATERRAARRYVLLSPRRAGGLAQRDRHAPAARSRSGSEAMSSGPAGHKSMAAPQRTDPTATARWIALFVLCVGVLMIVLDATVVNVALPSIQERPRLLAVEPRLGRQRLPDRLRRPAAARRPPRRPRLAPRRLPRRPGASSPCASLVCGARAEPGDAGRRALRPGRRRRDDLGRRSSG